MKKSFLFTVVLALLLVSVGLVSAQEMTDVGTPRNETLIFQTFDRQTQTPDQHNPLMNFAIWRGFRELGWGFLWETDTGTGESYPELAAEMPIPLNDEFTSFEVRLKQGVYWSDGEEFTADDVIFTLDAYRELQGTSTWFGVARINAYVSDYEKIDDYTVRIDTINPAYDFSTVLGVYTWGSAFIIVPEHIFSQVDNLAEFRNTYPVTIGPYTVKEFDPNGFWQLWELREDWERSAWGFLDEDGYMPQYILYKDYGPEETRSLSFVQNAYDVDTFMSPDSIKAAQARNEYITTFSPDMPYHNMDDACGYGVLMNLQRAPLDLPEVRWALALSLDLANVGINSVNGEFVASPLPMVDTQILRPIYFEPLISWLEELTLADGYQPYNANWSAEFVDTLGQMGAQDLPEDPMNFGIGWWKYDPEEAGNLLSSVGFTQNADGIWQLPSGEVWDLEFVIPGDWNKVMQRVGFSIADSWRRAGIQVNVIQVDNAEFGVVQNTNAERVTMLNWTNCIFTPNYLNSWNNVELEYVNDADATDTNSGNQYQWSNATVDQLVKDAKQIETTTEEFRQIGREIIQQFVTDMAYINIMNIPTTIPTNEYYWTGFPKRDNYYAVPYSWWSSVKEIVANIEPTGR
ncbi:MAG: ABC transporter substrate-binding protein [Anaerolineaceae bacterium]|nr:ABC transporter substrate-binding protein [Anaerolineae bacterium]MCB9461091.1 ABC transporter substrate-binding protein [Anaerolineaceae bacterium]